MRIRGCIRVWTVGLALVAAAACASAPEPVLPSGADIFLPVDSEILESRVPRNATLDGLLRAYDLPEDLVVEAIDAAREVFDPRRIRADHPYRIVRTLDGLLRRFEYEIDADRFLRIALREDGGGSAVDAEILNFEKETAVESASGAIDRGRPSLVAAMNGAGEGIVLALELVRVLSGEIDFNSDLRPGDSFNLVFEKQYREGQFAGYGSVLATQFLNEGRNIQAFRFEVPGDEPGYYDEEGRSLQRFFLRSPLGFEPRITSRFSYSRRHPVLGTHRPHLGVDYAAPHGAPVVAVASGTVVSAAWSGGSGRMVRLRHAQGYETYYLHLSSFANGIRPGARVQQGQLIGRVGSTGLATGPHLDYRVRKNGTFVDPVAEHRNLPPGEPVPGEHLPAFLEARDALLAQFAEPARPVMGDPELLSAN